MKDLRLQVRLLWAQACNWDGIHPNAPLTVFSKENPYAQRYNTAYSEWNSRVNPPEVKEEE